MTLEEAIMHSLDLLNKYKVISPNCDVVKEKQQLTEWLLELREFRKLFADLDQAQKSSRMLKMALIDLYEQGTCSTCRFYFENSDRCKECYKNNYEWHGYADVNKTGDDRNEKP